MQVRRFLEHSSVTTSLSFVPLYYYYHAHLSSLLFCCVFLYGILVPSQMNWLVFQCIILIEVGQFVKMVDSINISQSIDANSDMSA